MRKAQTLEKDHNLPVRRSFESPKSPVFALVAELNSWKAGIRSAPPENGVGLEDGSFPEPEPSAQRPSAGAEGQRDLGVPQHKKLDGGLGEDEAVSENGTGLPTDKRPNRRYWLRYGALTALAGAGATIAGLRLLRANKLPTSYNINGATLSVLAADGELLWRHTFPVQLIPDAYKPNNKACVFADLDGDGKPETLLSYYPLDRPSDRSLMCFDARGRRRWEFHPGKTVVDNLRRQFERPYWPNSFEVIQSRTTKSARVVVSSNHHYSFADQVAVLDGKTGRLLSEYWHRGHLLHLAVTDLDGHGEPSVLLGGVNDAPEYKQATLLIFDCLHISGATRNPRGGVYFQGMQPGSERCVVFFPRTPISKDQEFNRVVDLRVTANNITVAVAEGIGYILAQVIYEFDHSLQLLNAMLSDDLQQRYALMQKNGELPVETPEVIAERLKGQVKIVRYNS